MSPNLTISSICCLINQTVDQYTANPRVLRKDDENELLVELSQVLRQIQLWTHELRHDFNSKAKEQYEDRNCLMKVLSDLMFLVGVESQFLRHLAGNVLEAVSEFIAVCGCGWNTFIGLLCNYLRFAIENVLPYGEMPSVGGSVDWNLDLPSFCELEPALKNANWYTVGGVVGVLRNILKYLEHEDADQLLQVYLNSVGSMLIDLPWEQVDKVFVLQSIGICEIDAQNDHVTDVILGNAGENEPKVLFLGNFLQLLCSLVGIAPTVESEVGLEDKCPILSIIINSLPKIFCCSLGEPGSAELSIKQYFRHKLLVLMLRLTCQANLSCSTLFSWLQLLHDYFEELLLRPMIHLGNTQDECLEGSPFSLVSYGGEGHGLHSRHLQRLAVFLFLKCCFNLISLTGETNCSCGFETRNCLTMEPDSCRRKGSSELYKWLQGHISTEMLMDYETYSEKYMGFVLSFLKLYMHEDDLLFEVLLQLLSVTSYSEQRLQGEKCSFGNVKDNILFHVLNLFNPVCLFHLFLAELHYDHQVLLDYLISKDTGISCAEYLLRSLRTVCNSWSSFKNFSLDRRVETDSSRKRKFQLDDCQAQPSFLPSSFEEERKRDHEHEFSHSNSDGFHFKEAKDCLLSLKSSVENLHRKNLFPYNPNVILKRQYKTKRKLVSVEEMERGLRHFVLVHGACHGAWCWYKVATMLESAGHKVTALDLAASGIHPKQVNELQSISDYFEPLMEFMVSLPSDMEVILVGHSMGGLSISVAMEKFSEKISAAVFISATMHGPDLDYAIVRKESARRIGSFMDSQYAFDDGPDRPPTSLLFGPNLLSTKFYQLSPPEDLTLAKMLLRPAPIRNNEAEVVLTKEKYGSVPRVYIVCDQDKIINEGLQRWLIEHNPVDDVKVIEGSDHMAMFSKPQELCACLLDVAKTYF